MGEANPLGLTDRSLDPAIGGKKQKTKDNSPGETSLLGSFAFQYDHNP